jgi:hypothetical protein
MDPDPGLGRYIILAPKWGLAGECGSAYFWCQSGALLWKVDPLIFWCQNVTMLWRADPSLETGSRIIAKCSNILQDSYAERRYANCRYAERRGAIFKCRPKCVRRFFA